jgi:hypothetical protein
MVKDRARGAADPGRSSTAFAGRRHDCTVSLERQHVAAASGPRLAARDHPGGPPRHATTCASPVGGLVPAFAPFLLASWRKSGGRDHIRPPGGAVEAGSWFDENPAPVR